MRSTIILLNLLLALGAGAQSRIDWEKSYGGSVWDQPNAIMQTADGGYVAAGYTTSGDGDVGGNNGGEDVWIIKTDATGNLQWEQNYGGSGHDRAEDIRQTADGGYIVAGHSQSADGDVGVNKGLRDFWVFKLDAAGNLEWEKTYGGSANDVAYSVRQTGDGGYIVAGFSASVNGDVSGNKGNSDYWVLKLDAGGAIQWKRNYGGSQADVATSVEVTTDGGYVVAGRSESGNGDVGGNNGNRDYWVLKLNNSGDIQWQHNYGGSDADFAEEIQQTADGGYVIAGYSFSNNGDVGLNYGISDAWVLKTDASGNIQWGRVYGGFSYDEVFSIDQNIDGGFILGGLSRTPKNNMGGTNIDEAWILRLDPSGYLQWEEKYGGIGIEQALSVRQTTDNGFVIAGVSEFPSGDVGENNGQLDFWIIKLAALPGSIQGHIYVDYNENCVFDSSDTTLAGIVLAAENTITGEVLYGYTNPQGQFFIETDTVPYLLSYTPPSPYFDAPVCSPNGELVNLSGANPNGTQDFFIKPFIYCPYLTVDVSAPILRRCFDTEYYLSYCNHGTVDAQDAYLEVNFPPELTVTGSNIPWSTVNGNTYTFPVGNVGVLECGQFQVTVNVGCDSTFIGQTLCVEAHIYPDTTCVPVNNWNGAELKASATCIGSDTVELKLQNIGNANMQQAVPFLVIEDIIMRDGGMIQLNSQEIATWKIPVNGLSQRINAQQPADHPFKTFTTAAVNLCNTAGLPPAPGPINDFFTAYPDDEEAPYIAIDCQQIRAAYDPNDKAVHPAGASDQGFITATTDLTYKIRFQNTGNDTAFTIVLIDTIASHLDPATIQLGASSHPFVLELSGTGVLKFIFRDILLPDSTTNEPASHGFVQFTIKQKRGNSTGTLIPNQASIYFDFNPPVNTNTVRNKIGTIYLTGSVSTTDLNGKPVEVLAFPNPASDQISFVVNNAENGFDLLLYDAQGKMAQQIRAAGNTAVLYRNSMPEGLYFYVIKSGGVSVANGSLIFR